MRLAFDIEADGLYWDVSRIHCLVAQDLDTGQVYQFRPGEIDEALTWMMNADLIIGHNVIGFDIPALQKVYPWFTVDRAKVKDTLVLSRLCFPNLSDLDRGKRGLDGSSIGSHSLRAWGQRLNLHKTDYDGGWAEFSEEMLAYCTKDVAVTVRLWKDIFETRSILEDAVSLEHHCSWIVAEQERTGFLFDIRSAFTLVQTLQSRQAALEAELQDTFPPFFTAVEVKTHKRTLNGKKKSCEEGGEYTQIKLNVFNPSSRLHIAEAFKRRYNWVPKEFTENGQPKIDEEILAALPFPEAEKLAEYLMLVKRLGALSDGQSAWLKLVKPDSRIHGSVNSTGAVTRRATHSNPNMTQVPSVGAPYGKECRALFKVPAGKKLVGIDVSGLELRMLAHFMNDPDYAKEVVEGDVHTANQKAAGLETRHQAKTFIYAFLYGAGNAKIGSIVGKGAAHGAKLKAQFLDRTPSLKQLVARVGGAARERGYLLSFDKHPFHVRSEHAALNTLLQGNGAIVCKRWMCMVDGLIKARYAGRVVQVCWSHDECQFEADADLAEQFAQEAVALIVKTGEYYNLRVPLAGEYKIGNNWAETH
jgi:DNA polymerase I-like protein with 3'-5' exonuclease and polymerase domains